MRAPGFALTAMTLAVALLMGGLAPAQEVRAQTYPPPVGSLTVDAAPTTPGSTTNVDATVLDNDGNPVQGSEVTFTILSQPGSDAQWQDGGVVTTAFTDERGVATAVLVAGDTPGSIIIETTSGEMTSQVTVAVEEAAPEAGGLPETGGDPGGEGGVPTWQIVLMAIGAAALTGGFLIIARRNNRS